jgi:hypothetical protein
MNTVKRVKPFENNFKRPGAPPNTTQFLSYDYNYNRFGQAQSGLVCSEKKWTLDDSLEQKEHKQNLLL